MEYDSVAVIVIYLAAVTTIGSLLARRASSSAGWAVAGGGMGLPMVAVGIAGTRIGGAGTYGVAERAMSGGLWYMYWYAINTFLAVAIVGLFFARAYRRLGLRTVGEIFHIRFGTRRCQAMTSLCVQTEYLIVDVIEVYLIGAILTKLTPIPMGVAVVIAALILITYVALGGLWGSAVTNLIHCSVILVGLWAVGAAGTDAMGGWQAVESAVEGHLAKAGRDSDSFWSFAGAGWGAVLGMFFSAAIHTPAASVYTNFSTAARSERILLPSFLTAGVIAAAMPLLAGYVGIVTLARYGDTAGLKGYQNLTQLAMDINPIIGGVALAAIMAAVISSGGPILLSSATMFVNDWLTRLDDRFNPPTVRLYRITTAAYGLVAAVIAYFISMTKVSLLDLLLFGFAMVVPPAIAVGYLLYMRTTTERAAFFGMIAGYVGGLLWFFGIKLAVGSGFSVDASSGAFDRLLHYLFVHDGAGTDPSYATTLIPLVLIPLLSVGKARDPGEEEFYARLATAPAQ
ncbi:MAG: sodium:solute symporter family protein [Myxococcales bacterium]|nr:sodium:solute symporter family protein [Myxococcales bacterium]